MRCCHNRSNDKTNARWKKYKNRSPQIGFVFQGTEGRISRRRRRRTSREHFGRKAIESYFCYLGHWTHRYTHLYCSIRQLKLNIVVKLTSIDQLEAEIIRHWPTSFYISANSRLTPATQLIFLISRVSLINSIYCCSHSLLTHSFPLNARPHFGTCSLF